jgi:hypothetical protein
MLPWPNRHHRVNVNGARVIYVWRQSGSAVTKQQGRAVAGAHSNAKAGAIARPVLLLLAKKAFPRGISRTNA